MTPKLVETFWYAMHENIVALDNHMQALLDVVHLPASSEAFQRARANVEESERCLECARELYERRRKEG